MQDTGSQLVGRHRIFTRSRQVGLARWVRRAAADRPVARPLFFCFMTMPASTPASTPVSVCSSGSVSRPSRTHAITPAFTPFIALLIASARRVLLDLPILWGLFFLLGLVASVAVAAERFELRVPGTEVQSQAELERDELRITDSTGQTFRYRRQPEWDAPDGTYQAYFSAALGKVVRWPTAGTGVLQLGDGPVGPGMRFRDSKMQVVSRLGGIESSRGRPPAATGTRPVDRTRDTNSVSDALPERVTAEPQTRVRPPEELPNGGQQRPPTRPRPPLPVGPTPPARPPLPDQRPPYLPGPISPGTGAPTRPGSLNPSLNPTTAHDPAFDSRPKPPGAATIRVLVQGSRGVQAALIDGYGQPQFAIRRRDGRWDLQAGHLDQPLPAYAPLALLSDTDRLPIVFSVGHDGRLHQVLDGVHRDRLASHELVPQAQLEVGYRQQAPKLWTVDQQGRLVELRLDRASGETRFVEPVPGSLIPGSSLAVVGGVEAFVIDPQGTLRRYAFRGGWYRQDPLDLAGRPLAAAHAPGGAIAALSAPAVPGGPPRTHCFTWNTAGRLQIAYASDVPGRWQFVRIDPARGYPGSPLAVTYAGGRWSLSVVGVDGSWVEWTAEQTEGPWRAIPIAAGLSPRTATGIDPTASYAFALDRRGDLRVASRERGGRWSCVICGYEPPPAPHPAVLAPPVLISRQVIAATPLPAAAVNLVNRHERELWVVVADLRNPAKVAKFKIKPGETKNLLVDRDAGSRIIETWQIADPFGGSRIERNGYEVPPQPLYDVSVYERVLQSVAIDRTKRGQGRIEDVNWSPKSVGFFLLPAGPELPAKATIDLYAEAVGANNPGGVRQINPQEWEK